MATRTYEKGDLTVLWDSTRCIHTGICLRSLRSVFNLRNRPWVDLDGADAEQIIATVTKCPTGALRYNRAGEAEPAPEPTAMIPSTACRRSFGSARTGPRAASQAGIRCSRRGCRSRTDGDHTVGAEFLGTP